MVKPIKKTVPVSEKVEKVDKKDDNFEKSVDDLADIVVENAREGYHSDLEPFEAYAQKIRAQLHTNMNKFRERFTRGYQVLIDELKKQK